MRRYWFAVAVLVILVGCSDRPLTLEDIIERNAEAMGGRAALEAIQAIEIDLHIKDPGFEVDGTYRAARPGRMRFDLNARGRRVFTEAFDGRNGWQSHDDSEPESASPTAAAALRHGVELPGKLFGLHELTQRGHKIELLGCERVDGIDYHVLRLTFSDGYTTRLYIDPQSWVITRRRDVRPLHVDVDPTPTTIEQRSWDFREVAGVQFAFASSEIDLKTGQELETVKVNAIKVNPPIDQWVLQKR
jgi:hypothetical protein